MAKDTLDSVCTDTSSSAAPYPYSARAAASTVEGEKYIQRLCYHFSRKVQAAWEGPEGLVTFAEGVCAMKSVTVELQFVCRATSAADLKAITDTIDRHLDGFSKSTLRVEWAC